MTAGDEMASEFTNILNFRDVGQTINAFSGQHLMKTRKLFRSARPGNEAFTHTSHWSTLLKTLLIPFERLDEGSSEDRSLLKEQYGIKTVIDLRSKTEHIQSAQKHGARIRSTVLLPQSNNQTAQPLKIPGIAYREVDFNGSAFSRSLLWQLSWLNLGRLLGLMTLGYRAEAIRILGENVMNERGLIGLGVQSIDVCTSEVLEVFRVLSEPSNYPILVHCTQGKDRTGLVIQLILLLLDVNEQGIQHDYMLTGPALEPEKEERLKEIRSIGLSDSFAACDPRLVNEICKHIVEKYESVQNYLRYAGVSDEMQQATKAVLQA